MGLIITSKCGPFSISQHSLKFSKSTTDVLTVTYDKIGQSSSKATGYRAVVQEISKDFYMT